MILHQPGKSLQFGGISLPTKKLPAFGVPDSPTGGSIQRFHQVGTFKLVATFVPPEPPDPWRFENRSAGSNSKSDASVVVVEAAISHEGIHGMIGIFTDPWKYI